ncbi:DUF1552 domain-containing protein [Aureliella helgolandensis]|uniref:DUF1552 domain-containing protein n=1 Tax=Aureliella helgolandensis TaxID=2527968 RepID=A0A518G8C2_9BACT|nr:DUF1552 domain-containing protein [Aureliella helgolandensis]QDV24834.1 hypothetical protein Q31a_31560 [Aureliella helgolandensis]
MPIKKHLSRRTVLRGLGASVALPWLDIMGTASVQAGSQAGPPLRMAYFYVPNGVNMDAWRPTVDGPLTELSRTLQPLEPVKDSITVISNLAAEHCDGTSAAHEPAGGGFLVGKKCKHSEEPEVGGASVDQIAAKEIGLATPVDSLALGIDPGHRGDHGYSGTYMSHISWKSKTTPSALELNPKQLYERLFRGRTPTRPDWNQEQAATAPAVDTLETSVLDLVQEETRALQRKLGFSDRRKLESYLDGLRSIERRVTLATRDAYSHHQDAFTEDPLLHADEPDLPELIIPGGRGVPEVYADHVNLMLDILTLAFQSDTTRLATFMFSYEKSGRSYSEIEAPGSHHSSSHHQKKPETLEQLARINTHHIALFSRMLQRMAAIDEGGSSLLDNVLICYGSGISDGNRHNNDDLPILVAGGGRQRIAGGTHLNLEEKTPLCNLYLEMLNQAGIQRKNFGDSTERLNLPKV